MLIDWLRIGTRDWIRGLSMTSISGITNDIATWRLSFYLAYWLLYLDDHAFILAVALLEPSASPLVEQSPEVERLLSASLDAPYERCWLTSGVVWLLMKALRWFLFLGSPSKKWGSRGLAFDRYLPIGRTPHCQSLLWPCTSCCLRPQIPHPFLALVMLYRLALSL